MTDMSELSGLRMRQADGDIPARRLDAGLGLTDLRELLVAGSDADVAWRFESGQTVRRGELRRLAATWAPPAPGRVKQLVAIVCDRSRNALRDLVCALASGHTVILLPPDAPDFVRRVEQAFDPHLVAAQQGGRWTLRRRHERDLGLHPELALMLPTSGSTGENKFVRLSYANLLANARSIVQYLGLSSDDCALMNLPPHYSYGLSIVTSHLLCGASICVTARSVSDDCLCGSCSSRRAAPASAACPTATS